MTENYNTFSYILAEIRSASYVNPVSVLLLLVLLSTTLKIHFSYTVGGGKALYNVEIMVRITADIYLKIISDANETLVLPFSNCR